MNISNRIKFTEWSTGSKHFNPRTDPRLACRCCGMIAFSREIIFAINQIWEMYNEYMKWPEKPERIFVNSGTRCTFHNADIYKRNRKKGARESLHIAMPSREVYSCACDIRPANAKNIRVLHKICLKVLDGYGGCKLYNEKGFIHVDTREGRWRATE